MKNNENGRSMIEMLGVLAIIGVLSVGGILGYSKAMSKYRTNKVIEQATYLITNIRTMFAQQQNYDKLDNARAIDLGLVPEEMVVYSGGKTNGKLRNVFSGEVVVANSPFDALDETAKQGAFKVSFFGLSRDACIQIATSDWGAGSSSGLMGMHVWDDSTGTNADTEIDKVYNDQVASGTSTSSGIIAVPGDELDDDSKSATGGDTAYRIPLTVVQAQAACTCTNQTTCAVTWKYF